MAETAWSPAPPSPPAAATATATPSQVQQGVGEVKAEVHSVGAAVKFQAVQKAAQEKRELKVRRRWSDSAKALNTASFLSELSSAARA